jgi:hypothetical protein
MSVPEDHSQPWNRSKVKDRSNRDLHRPPAAEDSAGGPDPRSVKYWSSTIYSSFSSSSAAPSRYA